MIRKTSSSGETAQENNVRVRDGETGSSKAKKEKERKK